MLFKLTNKKMKRETHCGVLEFVADEGRIYIPYWVCSHFCYRQDNKMAVFSVIGLKFLVRVCTPHLFDRNTF